MSVPFLRRNYFVFIILGLVIQAFFNACSNPPFSTLSDTKTEQNIESQMSDENLSPNNENTTDTEDPKTPKILKPIVMAVGKWASTMYSCDGGESWIGYRSAGDDFRCWHEDHGNVDCNHHATSSLGITYGDLGFMVTFGWGKPGQVEISEDGQNWSIAHSGSNFAGVAAGNGTYILNNRTPLVSTDAKNWQEGGLIIFNQYNSRSINFLDMANGLFVSQGDVRDLLISTDNGKSFNRPEKLPANCGNGKIANSNDTIVLLAGAHCVSKDYGKTFQEIGEVPELARSLIYDGIEFKAYSYGKVYRSLDGISWIETPLKVDGVVNSKFWPELVSYIKDLNRYVVILQHWGHWYEETEYYYSDDGIDWTYVDKSSGKAPLAPHPMTHMTTGYSNNCPP